MLGMWFCRFCCALTHLKTYSKTLKTPHLDLALHFCEIEGTKLWIYWIIKSDHSWDFIVIKWISSFETIIDLRQGSSVPWYISYQQFTALYFGTVTSNEPPHDKTNEMACAPSEDSDQPGHPPSLIIVFAVHMKKVWVLSYSISAQRRLIGLGRSPGWSESSLGAHAILLVLSWGGSNLYHGLLWHNNLPTTIWQMVS